MSVEAKEEEEEERRRTVNLAGGFDGQAGGLFVLRDRAEVT